MVTKNYDIYYDKLNIDVGATEEKIKKAYKKLALKFHPDKNQGNEEATQKFLEIGEAYEKLMRMLRGEFSSDDEDFEFDEKEAELERLRKELERERRKEKRRKEQERWEEEFREEQTRKRLQREREEREEEFRFRTEQMRKERENMDRMFKERMKRTMGTFGSPGDIFTSYSSYSSPSSTYSTYSFSSNVGGGSDNFSSFSSFLNRDKTDDMEGKKDTKTDKQSSYSRTFKDDLKFGKDDPEEKLTPEYGSSFTERAKSTSPSFARYKTGFNNTETTGTSSDKPFSSYRNKYSYADYDEPASGIGTRSYLFTSNLSSPTVSVDHDDTENTTDPMNNKETKVPFSSFREHYVRSKSSTTAGEGEEDRRSPTKSFSSYLYSKLSQSSPASPRHSFSTGTPYTARTTQKTETSTEDLIAQIKKERGEDATENIDTEMDEKYDDLIAKIKHERGEIDEKTEKLNLDDSKDTTFSSRFISSPSTSRKSSYTFNSYSGSDVLSPNGSDPASRFRSFPSSTENLASTTSGSFRARYDLDDDLDSFPTRDYSSLPRKGKDTPPTHDDEDASYFFTSSSLPRRKTASERMKEQEEWERKFREDSERRRKAREDEERLNEEKIHANLLKQQQQLFNDRRNKQQWEERFANFPKIYREEMEEAKRQYASRYSTSSRETTSPSYSYFGSNAGPEKEAEEDMPQKHDITA